jgi:hypothetical protein
MGHRHNKESEMRIDIYVHLDALAINVAPSAEVPAWGVALLDSVEEVLYKLGRIESKENTIMTSVADVKAKADALLASVTAETDVVTAVKAVVDHSNQQISTLKQQLADAIAAGADPTALQTLSDTIDAIQSAQTSNATNVAAAVTAGTPVAVS